MAVKWRGKWPGGRMREVDGKLVYQLERMHAGRRYSATLEAGSYQQALAELALWERDPDSYRTKKEAAHAQRGPLKLDKDTIGRCLAHLTKQGRNEAYCKSVEGYLHEWREALAGRDLRRVTLKELKGYLAEWGRAERWRVIALKTFTAWARENDLLVRTEDPTQDLAVPPPGPAKAITERAYDMKTVEAFYSKVGSQAVRDVLRLRATTGLHATEIERLAEGNGVIREVNDPSGIAGTLTVVHKSGRPITVSVDALGLAAAQRLKAAGGIPTTHSQLDAMAVAAKRLGRTDTLLPSQLRHSFITWGVQSGRKVQPTGGGLTLEEMAEVVGHTTTRTTSTFYLGERVPPMVVLPLKFHHTDDPVPLAPKSKKAAKS